MKKLSSGFSNMALVLTGISVIVAAILVLVYSITKEPIEASKTAKQQHAVNEVLPSFTRLEGPESVEMEGGIFSIYKAYDTNHNLVGTAVEASSKNGFNGEIKIIVGFDKEANIVNYSILEQKETPGLGTKMTDWFKPAVQTEQSLIEKVFGFEIETAERKSSIIGKNPEHDQLTVSKDGGQIDAITAATITSRAFLEAICAAYEVYIK